MSHIPHLLIEGAIVSSYALGAELSYIYIRGEFMWIYKILRKAIAEAYANGWLGKNILGTGYNLDLHVHCGAGAYICGEETALLESLEGKRGNPRKRVVGRAYSGKQCGIYSQRFVDCEPWGRGLFGDWYCQF